MNTEILKEYYREFSAIIRSMGRYYPDHDHDKVQFNVVLKLLKSGVSAQDIEEIVRYECDDEKNADDYAKTLVKMAEKAIKKEFLKEHFQVIRVRI
jgi:DNA-binding transcriptional MerR regulator